MRNSLKLQRLAAFHSKAAPSAITTFTFCGRKGAPHGGTAYRTAAVTLAAVWPKSTFFSSSLMPPVRGGEIVSPAL